MDPEQPVPGMSETMLLRELPADAVDALVEVAGPGREIPFLSVEVRHIGARGEPHREAATARRGSTSPYIMFGVGMAMAPRDGRRDRGVPARAARGARAVRLAVAATSTSWRSRPTAAEPVRRRDVYSRLRSVKKQFDPRDVFRSNHPIPPAR